MVCKEDYMSEQDILKIKKRIEDAVAQGQQAVGQKKQIEERLEKEFGITSAADIPAFVEKLEKEKTELQVRIDSSLKRLQEKYGWA
jgi:hypothetical protein